MLQKEGGVYLFSIYGSAEEVLDCIHLLSDLALGYIPSSAFLDDLENNKFIEGVPVAGKFNDIDQKSPIAIILQGSLSNKDYINIIDKSGSCYQRLIIITKSFQEHPYGLLR